MSSSVFALVRRLLSVLSVLVLGVSVLVIAGSPAGAANTASEALYDGDNDVTTPEVRRFAGSNRYATSSSLATAFVGSDFVDIAILASGESLVDAAAAAGLARSQIAPVLLTTPNRLSRSARDFFEDQFIAEVLVLGGTSAISDAVIADIEAISTITTVTRVSGEDRYETSVAIAEEMGEYGTYCDSDQVGAIVVNIDNSSSDVISVGPLAYAQELPILLTRSDALPDTVAAFLTEQAIEHVVVVGGTSAVSNSVVADIEEAGVSTTTRITGANRFATAVAVRAAMAECQAIALSSTQISLVNGEAVADGVTAAPYLGRGVADSGDTGVIPVLLVTAAELPTETQGFLAGLETRDSVTTEFIDVELTAIGGTAVVPDAVVQAAIDAATTSVPITASIAVAANRRSATITFSDVVSTTDTTDAASIARTAPFSATTAGYYTIGGVPLASGDVVTLAGRVATLTLAATDVFVTGDVISVAGGKIRGGVTGDMRTVEAASYTVPAIKPDGVRPFVTIFAPEGGHEIRITVTEDSLKSTVGQFDVTKLKLGSGNSATAFPVVTRADAANPTVAELAGDPDVLFGSTDKDIIVCLFGSVGSADGTTVAVAVGGETGNVCKATPAAGQAVLVAKNKVTLDSETFGDNNGNLSRTTNVTVAANEDAEDFEAERATVTGIVAYDPTPATPGVGVSNAVWSWSNDGGTAAVDAAGLADNVNLLTVVAKTDAAASGAYGNAWGIEWTYAADPATAPNTTPNVSADVYKSRKLIRINVDEDSNLSHVVTTLLQNDEITDLFTITSDALTTDTVGVANRSMAGTFGEYDLPSGFTPASVDTGGPLGANNTTAPTTADNAATTSVRRNLTGGESAVTITLTYNDILQDFDYYTDATVDTGLLVANSVTVLTVGTTADTSEAACAGADPAIGERFANDVNHYTPTASVQQTLTRTVTYTVHSSCLLLLPVANDTIQLPAGVAKAYLDTANTDAANQGGVTTTDSAEASIRLRSA